MGMPAVIAQTGTGSVVWVPDWTQTPFQVGIGLIAGTTGVNGTCNIDVSFSNVNAVDINGVASTSATWFTIISLATANATANYTTPVQAFRLNVITATATSLFTVNFVQAGL